MSNNTNDAIIDKVIEGQPLTEQEKELDVDAYPEMKVEQAWEERKKTIFNDKERFWSWITQKN